MTGTELNAIGEHLSMADLRARCGTAIGLMPLRRRERGLREARGDLLFERGEVGVQGAALDAIRLACDFSITPSSSTLRPLALRVAPVVVMSTISSARPAAGAPSVAPRLSTMR